MSRGAHKHVATCAEKPAPDKSTSRTTSPRKTSRAVWEQHRKRWLAGKVIAHFRDKIDNREVRAKVADLKAELLESLDVDITTL